ncbi:MAG: carbohydrate ABC transporter permease, partial [Silvanigrellaceae bacterium]|nr:carbohydrate ABC transporter permease [Silvanigrellaceae bacterium]
MKSKNSFLHFFQKIFIHALLWLACCFALLPIIRILSISLKNENSLFSLELNLLPTDDMSFENYKNILLQKDFLVWFANSLMITLATSFIGVSLAATAAYAFSRYQFPGKKLGLIFLMITQMLPAVMLILPIYLILTKMALINSFIGLVLAYCVTALPFSIWILKGYFDSVPKSLEEAARLDGCNEIQAFYKILLPLSKPSLAITFLFNFTTAWNEYLIAQTVLKSPSLFTWPLGLNSLVGQMSS